MGKIPCFRRLVLYVSQQGRIPGITRLLQCIESGSHNSYHEVRKTHWTNKLFYICLCPHFSYRPVTKCGYIFSIMVHVPEENCWKRAIQIRVWMWLLLEFPAIGGNVCSWHVRYPRPPLFVVECVHEVALARSQKSSISKIHIESRTDMVMIQISLQVCAIHWFRDRSLWQNEDLSLLIFEASLFSSNC